MREENLNEVLVTAISQYSTAWNKTGNWRTVRPFYREEVISPCQDACPAGQDIPQWLNLVREGKLKEAWQILVEKNPLPFSTAKVCQGFCEKSCNRGKFCNGEKCDEPIALNAIERFLGELALLEKDWFLPCGTDHWVSEARRVAVIGAGPAGLSCASWLARRGCWVTVFEALPVIGGLLRTVIPDFRLPKDLLEREINHNIRTLFRLEIKTNHPIDKERFRKLRKEFNAIFIATGCHRPKKLGIPGEETKGVIYGLDFLKKVNLGEPLKLGERITVIGDGNTAIDCAHCARSLGKEVIVLCQKKREEIPDFLQKGIEAAEKKGVKFFFSVSILEINSEDGETDNMIIALGEEPDRSFINEDFSPEIAGVFIGGDATTQASNVAAAIASGREAAEKIISFLNGEKEEISSENREVVEFKDLNIDYFEHQTRQKKIIDGPTAIEEAKRCFSCGTCMGCENCYNFCPDVAVFKEENGKMVINYDYCKGCLVCQQECPCGVISSLLETEAIKKRGDAK